MTYDHARSMLPNDAKWSCSFGNPGETGYCEYWRDTNGRQYLITRLDAIRILVTTDA